MAAAAALAGLFGFLDFAAIRRSHDVDRISSAKNGARCERGGHQTSRQNTAVRSFPSQLSPFIVIVTDR